VLLAGVPQDDARQILGENVIKFLGLDRDALAKVAARINTPSLEDLTAPDAAERVDADLVAALDNRTGLFKPAEGARRLPEIDPMLEPAVARITAGVG
jgi:hypothetical protein